MFLRPNCRTRGEHTHEYWTLVESYRTARGSRQRVVAYLGDLNTVARETLQEQCRPEPAAPSLPLFDERQASTVDTAEWAERLEAGLQHLKEAAAKRPVTETKLSERVGRLRERCSRASRLYAVTVTQQKEGGATLSWERRTQWTEWADLAEGCYVLRSNVKEWTAEELWRAYIQLTEAEAAFRIQKQDLSLRPVWHQTEERVQAHILVCFLAYVLWKTLGRLCQGAGLGDCPRRVLEEIGQLRLVDVTSRPGAATRSANAV